jgi:hypothetical protein
MGVQIPEGVRISALLYHLLLKYLQGLGSSDDMDGKRYFNDMKKHMIPFATVEEGDKELIDLAFSKKKADDRKEWLRQFKVNVPALFTSLSLTRCCSPEHTSTIPSTPSAFRISSTGNLSYSQWRTTSGLFPLSPMA